MKDPATQCMEQLKDRTDYRRSLIERRNALDIEIDAVEIQILAIYTKGSQ